MAINITAYCTTLLSQYLMSQNCAPSMIPAYYSVKAHSFFMTVSGHVTRLQLPVFRWLFVKAAFINQVFRFGTWLDQLVQHAADNPDK